MNNTHSFSPDTLTAKGHAAKQKTRQTTFDLLRRSDYWMPDAEGGYLNGGWIELCGHHDETLKMLLDANALRPGKGRYIGVNGSEEVIQANQERYKDATEAGLVVWVLGTWANTVSDLDRYPDARVVVFDGFNALSNTSIGRILRDSTDLAEDLYRRNGSVLLVMNFCLRGCATGAKDHCVEHLYQWRHRKNPGNGTKPAHKVYKSKRVPMLNVWLPLGF